MNLKTFRPIDCNVVSWYIDSESKDMCVVLWESGNYWVYRGVWKIEPDLFHNALVIEDRLCMTHPAQERDTYRVARYGGFPAKESLQKFIDRSQYGNR